MGDRSSLLNARSSRDVEWDYVAWNEMDLLDSHAGEKVLLDKTDTEANFAKANF